MKRLAVVGVVLALLCGAAGAGASPSAKGIAAARERAAGRRAEELLGRIPLPAGARPTWTAPAVLHKPGLWASVKVQVVWRYRYWKLREPVGKVGSAMQRHPLPGCAWWGGGVDVFDFDCKRTHLAASGDGYELNLARWHGWTFVRADVGAAWNYPRLPQEALPAGVREVDARGIGARVHVVDPTKVAPIVRWFGQLSHFPPLQGVWPSCYSHGVWVTFTFRSASGAVLAHAGAYSGGADGCNPVSLTVGRKTWTTLVDSTRLPFVQRVGRLLGVCFWAGPYSVDRFSLPCSRAWADHVTEKLLDSFRLPSGARSLAHEPLGDGGLLRSPSSVSGSGELVDRHRFWRVRASLAKAETFVTTHQPLARRTASSAAHRLGVPPNHSVTLAYPHIARNYAGIARTHFTPARHIEVTFVALPHGWTGIRADAQVTWVYPRTKSRLGTPGSSVVVNAGPTRRLITNHRTLEQITARFNRLQVVPPGRPYSCPARPPKPTVTIYFHGHSWTASAVVHGTGLSTACNPIRFCSSGTLRPLIGGDFVRWLLGPQVRAATPLGRASAAHNRQRLARCGNR